LIAVMVAASMPSRSIALSAQLSSLGPRMIDLVIGRVLVLMIDAVERRRDRRLGLAR
jgi:hypothetical protein